jgi:hypothetical protein
LVFVIFVVFSRFFAMFSFQFHSSWASISLYSTPLFPWILSYCLLDLAECVASLLFLLSALHSIQKKMKRFFFFLLITGCIFVEAKNFTNTFRVGYLSSGTLSPNGLSTGAKVVDFVLVKFSSLLFVLRSFSTVAPHYSDSFFSTTY